MQSLDVLEAVGKKAIETLELDEKQIQQSIELLAPQVHTRARRSRAITLSLTQEALYRTGGGVCGGHQEPSQGRQSSGGRFAKASPQQGRHV
jgi:hypothetical protein